MSQLRYLEPMDVVRVRDDTGSHIEPPLDQSWPEEDKLRWVASVTAHDTGHEVRINVQPKQGRWRPTLYGYNFGHISGSAYDYREMWVLLAGFDKGVDVARRAAEDAR